MIEPLNPILLFVAGFVCGSLIMSLCWFNSIMGNLKKASKEIPSVIFDRKVKKPDNAKARKFGDPRYRAWKEEELKRKAPGGQF